MQPHDVDPRDRSQVQARFTEAEQGNGSVRSPWTIRLWFAYLSLLLAVALLAGTGLIPGWGQWYSTRLDYRKQTEALLEGRTGLSTDVRDLEWDHVWDGGVSQQVWGLGVPVWRLGFEALARMFGSPAFPDRFAFGIALILTFYAVLSFHRRMASGWKWLCAVPLLVSPYYLILYCSGFIVYEEAVAYEFLAATVLLLWTLRVWNGPRAGEFAALALVAGLAPFIRPTLVFYALPSLTLSGLAVWRYRLGWRRLAIGGFTFAAGTALLLWSNSMRFGAATEFGHALNINNDPAMRYASRFDAPFRHESARSAARELFSLLFLVRSVPEHWTHYGKNIFPGQSDGFRWRAFGLNGYDLTCAVALVVIWGWALWRRMRGRQNSAGSTQSNLLEPAVWWSMVSAGLLFGFYLRCPFIASRYLMDFAPAFAVGTWAFWWLAVHNAERWQRKHPRLQLLALAALGVWWFCAVITIDKAPSSNVASRDVVLEQWAAAKEHSLDAAAARPDTNLLQVFGEAVALELKSTKPLQPIPRSYTNGFDFETTGIIFNGSGWKSNGAVLASVALFVNDPECLILDVVPANSEASGPLSYTDIRAKIGLEFLERQRMTPLAEGMRLVFHGPKRKRYQRGVQVVFLAMVPVEALDTGHSPFRLLRAAWRKEDLESGTDAPLNRTRQDELVTGETLSGGSEP